MLRLFLALQARAESLNDLRDEKGATAVEYGIMVALIAAVIIGVVTTLGEQVEAAFEFVSGQIPF